MLDTAREHRLFSISELARLRIEAMHLFEQCLTSGNKAPLVKFIQDQLLIDPPRLNLLNDLADDLQLRLLSLREYHFDVREQVIHTLLEDYDVDITPLAPASKPEMYHELDADTILQFVHANNVMLSADEQIMLAKMIEASIKTANQLHNDIELTSHIHSLVVDWLNGLSATIARNNWQAHVPGIDEEASSVKH